MISLFRVYLFTARNFIVDFVGELVYFPIEFLFFYLLYSTLYRDETIIGGFSYNEALLYIFIVLIIEVTYPSEVLHTVVRDISRGNLVLYLTRPISYPIYILIKTSIKSLVFFAWGSLIVTLASFAFSVEINLLKIFGFLTLYILGFIMYFLLRFLVAVLSFWIGRNYWVSNLMSIGIHLLGGAFIPLSWYPTIVKKIVALLPFQAIFYIPARFYLLGEITPQMLLAELLWILILALGVKLLWKLGLRRYEGAYG